MDRLFSLSLVVLASFAVSTAFCSPFQVSIWGSSQYIDQGDMAISGCTFYNPFGTQTAKEHNLSLSGTTLLSSQPWAAQAYASASLHTASLKIKALASGTGFASAGAKITDTIMFQGAYNGICDGQPCYSIPVSFTVDGTISGQQDLSAGIRLGSVEVHQKVASGVTTVFSGLIHTTGPLSLCMYLNTDGYVYDGFIDFTNTAQFSWQLPSGVTYTSDSGAFLAPEPATMLTLTTGILAVHLFGRRKALGS